MRVSRLQGREKVSGLLLSYGLGLEVKILFSLEFWWDSWNSHATLGIRWQKFIEFETRQLSPLPHEALTFSSVENSIMWTWLWTLLLGGWAALEEHGRCQVGLTTLCMAITQGGSQKFLVGVWVVSVVLPNEGKRRIFYMKCLFMSFRESKE